MRRVLLVSVAVFAAAVLAVSVSLFAFPEISQAGSSPSQGTYTQGATAGPNEPSLVRDTPPTNLDSASALAGARVRRTGQDVVRIARWHLGTRYVSSPPGVCRGFKSEDCSCTTRLVFKRFGKTLPDRPGRQWHWGQKVARSDLHPGDLVFFKEAGMNKNITHVGIYSGRGNLIHASNYFGKVVESKMSYMHGYFGAKRLRLNH
jgi:cell wall-associated NlpC family hydrolase